MTNEEWIAAFREYAEAYMRNGCVFPDEPGATAMAAKPRRAPRPKASPRQKAFVQKPRPERKEHPTDGHVCMDCGRDISTLDWRTKRCPACKRKWNSDRQKAWREENLVREVRKCASCGAPLTTGFRILCKKCSAEDKALTPPKERPHPTCIDCGTDITMLNWHAQRCPECSHRHALDYQRKRWAEREKTPRTCIDCGVDISQTTKAPARRCPECRKKEAARQDAEKRARRRERGMCVHCGSHPPVDGGTTCRACREKINAWERSRVEKARAANVRTCIDCGADIAARGGNAVRCRECAEKKDREYSAASNRRREARLRERGLCVRCGRAPHAEGYVYCEECRAKRNATSKRHYDATHGKPEPSTQGRTCPDCGIALPDGYANSYCPECIAERCRKAWEDARRKGDGA